MSHPSREAAPGSNEAVFAAPKLLEVLSAVRKVRLRLRVQAALQGLVYGLIASALALVVVVVLRRFGVLSASLLLRPVFVAVALVLGGLLGALGSALRRIDKLEVAARIDKSHALHDRLASALQFVGVGSTPALDPQKELRELAIADAERVAQGVIPSRAAPFARPLRLGWLGLAGLALVAAWSLKLPRPSTPIEPPKKRTATVEPRLTIDGDLLEPEKEELRELIKQAEQAGDKEALELLKQMQKLLEQVERGEISRKQAFEMLAELERRLAARAQEGALEELKERLRKAGSELGEAKLAKELGQALLKEDLEKAQKELKRLAAEALSKAQKSGKSKEEKDALSKAFERAAEAMRQQNQKSDKTQNQNERDLDKQKDEWKDKTKSEELTRKMQELKDEERRLKKKLEQNPNDEETERRLKKNQRELEQLEREKQEREQARRELEQLERDMQRAAEEMRKQLEKMTPEQRKALEKMAEDLQRMQQQMKQMQQRGQGQQQMRSSMTVALGSIKQVLRRIARNQGQGQDGQQGQNGQGQNGQGQGQGQGQGGSMKDYMNRARGKGGNSDNEVLVEGEGNGKDGQQVMLLGQGNDPVIIPGLGNPGGGDQGNGQQGMGQGGEKPGNQHDPNMLGNATQIDSKRRLTRVYGKDGAGPTRSETILGAAEKGFATQPYRRVYRDYSAVSEKVMSQQRVPPGYRFYVKRYFQMIKPRE